MSEEFEETVYVGMKAPASRQKAAVLGGIATFATCFLPFVCFLLGGTAAGYLRGPVQRESVKTGAFAGAVASIPLLLFVLFFAFVVGLGVASQGAIEDVGSLLGVLGVALGTIVSGIGLGALGGLVGSKASNRRPPDAD